MPIRSHPDAPRRAASTSARLERSRHHRVARWLLAGLLWAGAPVMATAAETSAASEGWTDRLILRYRGDGERQRALAAPAVSPRSQASLHRTGLQVIALQRRANGVQVLQLQRRRPVSHLRAAAEQLMTDDPDLLWAEPDYRMQAQATASDPLFSQQWHYSEARAGINLPAAWDLSTGRDVVVAVIDSGVRAHADLAERLLPGMDLIGDLGVAQDGDGRDDDADDPGDGCHGRRSSWHGTHVAGTIAASANNGLGGTGVAPDARLLPVRVLGCGGGYTSDIADGVVWAAGGNVAGLATNPYPARVLNLSLGGAGPCSATMQSAIDSARSRGAVVVVAAGNNNALIGQFSPANCQGVVTVSAVDRQGARAPYSNYGTLADLAAPGGNMNAGAAQGVLSTLNEGSSLPSADGYGFYQGTSMAAPHVAGTAALMLSRRPDLRPFEVEVLLRSLTRAFPTPCSGCGTGLLDAGRSLAGLTLGATAGPRLAEIEPNQGLSTGQRITTSPAVVNGQVSTSKDLDFLRIPMTPGATLKLRLVAPAETNLDLQLYNAAGALLASSARATGLSDALNWLHRGFDAVDVYARVHWVSGGIGPVAGAYGLELAHVAGPATVSLTEVEPNDRHASAMALTAQRQRVQAAMGPARDPDIYKLTVPAGATLVLRLRPTAGSNLDLELRNPAGSLLGASRQGTGLADYLVWTNPATTAAEVYPRVIWVAGGTGSTAGAYTLETAH